MLRWLFIVVHLILAGYLVGSGVAAYRVPDAGFDAGVTALFCAFWFFFAAAGFYLRHVWFVTIANLALFALVGLFLFLAAVELYARGGGAASLPWVTAKNALGLSGFLASGQIYAVVLARRNGAAPGAEQKPSRKSLTRENRP